VVVVVVVDAANLQRNLYYATQVIELGYPTILALNMIDVAEQNGHVVDAPKLGAALGIPVVPMVASKGTGVDALRAKIVESAQTTHPPKTDCFCRLPPPLAKETEALAQQLSAAAPGKYFSPRAEALLLLSDDRALQDEEMGYSDDLRAATQAGRSRLEAAGIDWRSAAIEARYARMAEIVQAAVTETATVRETFSDRLDRVVTHRVWGMVIFLALMALIFQSIFVFARLPMDFLAHTVDSLGGWVSGLMAPGPLNDLLVNGVIKGVGAVVVFLPQILFLFLFICLLEDTGYMARAAFIMDHLMSKVGLHGKSFIPMLSSFACAIPGIMATRTIESPKDRLVTILIAPLMSCSARLPVYTVLIGACIPDIHVLGVFPLPGLTMLGAYLLGVVAALGMAWVFKKTLLKATAPLLIMELPPYKRPGITAILRHIWDRSKLFLTQAGTVILGINILLWFLASYPRSAAIEQKYTQQKAAAITNALPASVSPEALAALDAAQRAENLQNSFAGRMGRLIEPVIKPLGFDWKIGIGILTSFAAREVFVSTMSVVYNAGQSGSSDKTTSLAKVLQAQRRPDGKPVFTALTGVTLMVFYVFALQCASTVAVVRRETNSWKWPLFQWVYLGLLAWGLSFLVYQGGKLLGWG
jgi:ferrous iron transport protein B